MDEADVATVVWCCLPVSQFRVRKRTSTHMRSVRIRIGKYGDMVTGRGVLGQRLWFKRRTVLAWPWSAVGGDREHTAHQTSRNPRGEKVSTGRQKQQKNKNVSSRMSRTSGMCRSRRRSTVMRTVLCLTLSCLLGTHVRTGYAGYWAGSIVSSNCFEVIATFGYDSQIAAEDPNLEFTIVYPKQ